ncbi:MAG: DUF58 domain-containing protein [Candidatus Muiribacteriota bacterium]
MQIKDLMKKVRKIHIKTNRLVDELFGGEFHSAFKGKGIEFTDLRKYEFGDDIRSIDWKVTARFNEPYIKVFEEERELSIMLLTDISPSMDFGSLFENKKQIATEIASIISLSAVKNRDKVGSIFFSDDVNSYYSLKKGLQHSLVIIRDMIARTGSGTKTNYEVAADYLLNSQKKKAVVFFISDFINFNSFKKLGIINKKHDLICVRIKDRLEKNPPEFFYGNFLELESGKEAGISFGDNNLYKSEALSEDEAFKKKLKKYGIDLLDIMTEDDYVKKLNLFFKKRIARKSLR